MTVRGAVSRTLIAGALWVSATAPPAAAQLSIEGLPAEIQPVEPTFPASDRYSEDAIHGTVLDTVTGLVWLRTGTCDDLPGIGVLGDASWSEVMQLVATVADGECGLADGSRPGDWRLATVDEWQATIARAVAIGCTDAGTEDPPSLTDRSGFGCFDDDPAFQIVQFLYWTSTADDVDPSKAWSVNLVDGTVGAEPKASARVLWPVRDRR